VFGAVIGWIWLAVLALGWAGVLAALRRRLRDRRALRRVQAMPAPADLVVRLTPVREPGRAAGRAGGQQTGLRPVKQRRARRRGDV
jgi:hypothetical protein